MKTFFFCFLAACVASFFIIPACSPLRRPFAPSDSSISPAAVPLPEENTDFKQGGGAGGGGGGSWGDDVLYVEPRVDSPSELDYSSSPYITSWFPAVLTMVSGTNQNVNCQMSDGTTTRDYWWSNIINNPSLIYYQVRQAYSSTITFTTVVGFHYGHSSEQSPYIAWYIFDSSSASGWLSEGAKLYRLTENDVEQTGLSDSLPSDPNFNGSNWFEFLYNFGGQLLGSDSLSALLTTEILGQSFLSLLFGAGFLVFAGYVVLKWVIPS